MAGGRRSLRATVGGAVRDSRWIRDDLQLMISDGCQWLTMTGVLTCHFPFCPWSRECTNLHGKEKVNGSIPFGGSQSEQRKRPVREISEPGVSDRPDPFAMDSRWRPINPPAR